MRAIVSNTSATAETVVERQQGPISNGGRLVSRTETEELSLDSGLWSRS
jgi:hypothetical protein